MAKYNIQALPFAELSFGIELRQTPSSRPIPVRRMTVGGHLENNFTTVFVGSSGLSSDIRGTGRKCNFTAVFLHDRLFQIVMAYFGLWGWQYCLCGQEP
jgi:hypothetical protein